MNLALSPKTTFTLAFISFLFCFLSTNAQNSVDPPSMKPGLEVDRSVLINKIMQSDSGITFKKEDDVNGSSNYIGIDNTIAIQLIGSEHELTLAKFTFAFTQDKALNRKEILKLYNFAYILTAKPGYEWLISVFNNFEITKGFDETQIFNFDRKGEFKYVPGDKKFVLTFVPF